MSSKGFSCGKGSIAASERNSCAKRQLVTYYVSRPTPRNFEMDVIAA
jgi:hypothetical protein